MTCKEKLEALNPECDSDEIMDNCCPSYFNYLSDPNPNCNDYDCTQCWNREIPEKKLADVLNETGYVMNTDNPNVKEEPIHRPEYDENKVTVKPGDTFNVSSSDSSSSVTRTGMIKDSGARREFETGAVSDIHDGKGRCDLMPLDVVAELRGQILKNIYDYQISGNPKHLHIALQKFIDKYMRDMSTALLEVSIHFEEGAKKYGEYNWQLGIPTHYHIDSAVRHYLKFMRGDKDERHDRAFIWRLLCCIWTCIHKPELNDYAAKATCEDTPQLKKG